MKNVLIGIFNPHAVENDFDRLFKEHIREIKEGSRTLLRIFESRVNPSEGTIEQLVIAEHRADTTTKHVHALINARSMPEYDKPDIKALVHFVDNIIDGIKRLIERANASSVLASERNNWEWEHGLAFARLIDTSVGKLFELISTFPKLKLDQTTEVATYINDLEKEGDKLLLAAVAVLYEDLEAPFTHRQRAWEKIFEQFEMITDDCQHAADVLHTIATKL